MTFNLGNDCLRRFHPFVGRFGKANRQRTQFCQRFEISQPSISHLSPIKVQLFQVGQTLQIDEAGISRLGSHEAQASEVGEAFQLP